MITDYATLRGAVIDWLNRPDLESVVPRFIQLADSRIAFDRRVGGWVLPSRLSATNSTNEVLTEAPMIYLYAALLEAAPYLKDDERVPMWVAAFEQAAETFHRTQWERDFVANPKRPARTPFGG